ncbi:hypothetical protein J2W54_003691 [Rhodococcus fascians]|jgi:hypothetical protein|uniref:Unannotated protein n=1 Tax=freshwater metagenome TaxID=449393 RepID=A0A6J7F3T1_9ZZZZ|nr:hypothetical protein VF34_00032 [Rhodococcus sp. PML026]MDQ0279811.1 hypothetical protein [Rhodococcus fascians]MDR6911731.1 hypothetical protein [Rhodococcus sp. 3258]MDR6933290.1 hypothetical protein [Rhodococcus fascians]
MTWLKALAAALIDRLGAQPACTAAALDFGTRG